MDGWMDGRMDGWMDELLIRWDQHRDISRINGWMDLLSIHWDHVYYLEANSCMDGPGQAY